MTLRRSAAMTLRRPAAAVATAALLVAAGGASRVAYASIPSSTTGLINACVSKTTGAIRAVDTQKSQRCSSNETWLQWYSNTTEPEAYRYRTTVQQQFTVPGNSHVLADVKCPSGLDVIGGGAHVGNTFPGSGNAGSAYVSESDIDDSFQGWASTLVNGISLPYLFTATAICIVAQ